jgi:predicted RNA binding protein YcfA (HicA-like mRNA interferase family)
MATLSRSWGYRKVNQEGSHVTLQTDEPTRQRVVVPDHKILRIGTLNAILRQVAGHKGITREAILATIRS